MCKITLGLDASKNMHYIKKCFKLKLLSIKFCTKMSGGTYVYLTQERSFGVPKIVISEILLCTEMGK